MCNVKSESGFDSGPFWWELPIIVLCSPSFLLGFQRIWINVKLILKLISVFQSFFPSIQRYWPTIAGIYFKQASKNHCHWHYNNTGTKKSKMLKMIFPKIHWIYRTELFQSGPLDDSMILVDFEYKKTILQPFSNWPYIIIIPGDLWSFWSSDNYTIVDLYSWNKWKTEKNDCWKLGTSKF